MDQSFQKGSDSEGNRHQHIGGLEPVHVRQEVTGQFPILIVISQVAREGAHDNHEHEQKGKYLHQL